MLAAQQLGACIPAASERISEAVDALGGQDSVKVSNLKVSIGISSGGLCKVMRQSTPLLQFFVLCAACKTTLLDDECSTLMFEMLKTSTVLAKLPCSAGQIMRMITQFSGQAEAIAPADNMHEVASAVDKWTPEAETFCRMDPKVLAEMLFTVFDHVRDEAVDSMLLVGHKNSIWLASSLLWLLGDKAWLLIGDKAIKGDSRAKLCIQIEPTQRISWSLQVFKASDDPTKFVFEMPGDDVDTINRIPLRLMKSFMNHYYWSFFEDTAIRTKAMIASGIIAQTLIMAISQRGRLYLKCGDCKDSLHCNEAPLAAIVQDFWLAAVGRRVTSYGWADSDGAKFDTALLKTITDGADAWATWRSREENALNSYENSYERRSLEWAEQSIKAPCRSFIKSYFPGEKVESDYILDPALFIAADASVTCTTFFQNGGRFINPMDAETLRFADRTVALILSHGLEASDFREKAFKQLLLGLDTWRNSNLVVARDGYVASMNILWAESPWQSEAFSIRVQKGQIRKDQVNYEFVCESPFTSFASENPRVPAFDAVRGIMMPDIGWQHPIKDRAYVFETMASVHGSRVEVKHYMTYVDFLSKLPRKRIASWISTAEVIAMATHLDVESQLTASLEESLNRRLTQQLISKDVCWTKPFSSPSVDCEVRTLMRTGANRKVKVFGAAFCNERREACCHIIIRHRSPLLQCISTAESKISPRSSSWIIVD